MRDSNGVVVVVVVVVVVAVAVVAHTKSKSKVYMMYLLSTVPYVFGIITYPNEK